MVLRKHLHKSTSKALAPSTRTSLIALLAALTVLSNYALIWLPNVKLMDLLVFLAGFLAGPLDGAIVGVLGWAIYGFLNPYGWILPIWIATMISETVYGILGGILKMKSSEIGRAELAIAALISTLLYDLATNIAFSLTFNVPILMVLIAGIPFSIVHTFSNVALFSIVGPELIKLIERLFSLRAI